MQVTSAWVLGASTEAECRSVDVYLKNQAKNGHFR
jgi:hypothetical protein